MPPFSALTRIAAGSLRDSQLFPSHPTADAAKSTPSETAPSRVTGRTARAVLSVAIPLPMPKPTQVANKAAESLALEALSGKAPEPRVESRQEDQSERKMAKDTLTITDNRTGKTYEVPIAEGTIRALDLRQIMVDKDDFGLMTYDPAFMNTASCRSAITYIDGDKGILRYRGYPVDQLAENASYLEVAYLLINGELPTQTELDKFTSDITHHTFVHENVRTFIDGFRYDAHPMGMLVATVSALSTFYPEAKHVLDHDIRRQQMVRLIAKMPTLAAWSYRHSMGMPFVYPSNEVSYSENFLQM